MKFPGLTEAATVNPPSGLVALPARERRGTAVVQRLLITNKEKA